MAKHNDRAHYDFTSWQAQLIGRQPNDAELHVMHMLGLRPGKQALACAMALRPQGVTGSEIVIACGAPQLNRMRGLISDGAVKREAVPARNGHTVYKLTLTPKGEKAVAKAEAKPQPDTEGTGEVKAKGNTKRARKAERKAKVKAAEGSTTAALPEVTVPVAPAPEGTGDQLVTQPELPAVEHGKPVDSVL